MKNQYFGDFNDYVKYALLRSLVTEGLKLSVCWMMTKNDGRPDGKKLEYLQKPSQWSSLDPKLFQTLATATRTGQRNVQVLEESGLLPGASYVREAVPDGDFSRSRWFARAQGQFADSNVIFFDPDNGLEVPSRPKGSKDSSKYVFWDELIASWNQGKSLVIFQHFIRENRDDFISRLESELTRRLGDSIVRGLRTPNVLFLVVSRQEHWNPVSKSLASMTTRWGDRISLV